MSNIPVGEISLELILIFRVYTVPTYRDQHPIKLMKDSEINSE